MEHSEPVAYCVAGRHPTVILTTGALQALDPAQLDAVLAHERAHLAGHHHQLLALARIGRLALPFLPLMRDADAQVARLVEMHADDAATRACDPRSLATALVALATAATPAPALAAAATDAVQRIPPGRWAGEAASRYRSLTGAEPGAARTGSGAGGPRARPGSRRLTTAGRHPTMAAAGDTLRCSGLLPHRHRSQERQVSWARPSGAWR